jgi:hypothetical protein
MSRIILEGTVLLPFSLDICAIGDRIEPLVTQIGPVRVMIDFPRAMTSGATGKCIYGTGWAWWSVDRINLSAEAEASAIANADGTLSELRGALLSAAQEALRRMLNSYRVRLKAPQIHPVPLNANDFALALISTEGKREELPEPEEFFFYNVTPSDPPLASSISAETIAVISADVASSADHPSIELFALDAQWLKSLGEVYRAVELEGLLGLDPSKSIAR